MHLPRYLLLLVVAVGAGALDVNGDTAYLARKLRPEWRLVSLQSALDEIAKAAEKPVERSARVVAQQKDALVVLVARQRWTLQEILSSLERTHALRVNAGPLRLTIETEADVRDRRRRPVQINLDEFAAHQRYPDQAARVLGYTSGLGASRGGFDVFSGVEVKKDMGAEPAEVLELIRASGDDATVEMRANVAHLLITPEEETLMRALLLEQYQFATRRGTWRATFGSLPAGEGLATGVLGREAATALAARLQQRSELTVAVFNAQLGNAGAVRQQSLVQDAEAVNGMLDPVIEVLSTGRQFQVRAIRGTHFDSLAYHLQWVEPITTRARALRLPAGSEPGTLSMQAEQKKDDKELSTSSANAATATTTAGQRAALQQPEVWTWTPRGDVMLPRGHALVLCAAHGEQTAVIICAEVQ